MLSLYSGLYFIDSSTVPDALMAAGPHSVSFIRLVPLHSPASMAAVALVVVGLVDGIEICAQAELARAHLRAGMQAERLLPWSDPS